MPTGAWILQNSLCYNLPHVTTNPGLPYTMCFAMVYQFQNTVVDHGIPCILPWYIMVYHGFYHGLPVSKYHGIP